MTETGPKELLETLAGSIARNSDKRHCELLLTLTLAPTLPLPEAVDNPGFAQIIGRHLEFDPVAQVKSDKALSHLARNVGQYHLLIGKLYSKHCSRKNRDDFTFDWNGRLSGHGKIYLV
jgi:hypothetical protein